MKFMLSSLDDKTILIGIFRLMKTCLPSEDEENDVPSDFPPFRATDESRWETDEDINSSPDSSNVLSFVAANKYMDIKYSSLFLLGIAIFWISNYLANIQLIAYISLVKFTPSL